MVRATSPNTTSRAGEHVKTTIAPGTKVEVKLVRDGTEKTVNVELAERPGNKLADSLRNILANPNVGLLFLVPGVGDTLRVNGRATLTTDVTLLEALAVEGKTPKLALLIEVDEVFTHCSKAFIRSDLWNPEQHIERDALPSQGAILRSLNPDIDAKQYDVERAERYARREGLY